MLNTRTLNALHSAGVTIADAQRLSGDALVKLGKLGRSSIRDILTSKVVAYDIVVTRHKGLLEFLRNKGLISSDTPTVGHAQLKDVEGLHVLGILPLNLAAKAASITTVDLEVPIELRGKELSAEQTAQHYVGLTTYRITAAK